MELKVFTDGGSRGNPGPAACGIVFESEEFSHNYGFYLGRLTNNQAEYAGLIVALKILKDKMQTLVVRKVYIHMDSELIVRQVMGIYKVRDEKLKPVFAEVQGLLQQMPMVQFKHVPREQNRAADQMVNETLDAIYGISDTFKNTTA